MTLIRRANRTRRKLPIERFLEAVRRNAATGCWEWTHSTMEGGYGRFYDGKADGAHRFSYQFFCGPIPDGLLVCHTCDNPPCVNPTHLFLGTHAKNTADMISKDRQKWPGRPLKPSEDDRKKLIAERAAGEPLKVLAERYGITMSHASRVARGRR